ncbi:hypothetical protein IFM89_036676 [Coptis chinensis]|uniref:Uncharacterized protein n=1 Tax=Coptis chinensis TaxID=261450 RepID=A0A835I9Q3_9MAGN|nr:hypothetical protein IFM89_036676 [Coptis chinensis]
MPSVTRKNQKNVRKLPILIDIDGVVVGDNASVMEYCVFGSLIRARIPVSYTDWRLVHSEFKDKVWNALMVRNWWRLLKRKEKVQLQVERAKATHLDFDNDEIDQVLGADKKSRTRGISSNLSKKQLKHTSIAKVMLAQARSSSNSEFKGEMSEMKSSIARVEGVLMDMLKLVTNNGMSNSQPPHGDTTPNRCWLQLGFRPPQQNLMNMFESMNPPVNLLPRTLP